MTDLVQVNDPFKLMFNTNNFLLIKKFVRKVDNIADKINIVMCCWKRFENLEAQFIMLNNQTVSKEIHWHLINNNYGEKEKLDRLVEKYSKIYHKIKVHVTHYKNKFYCFQRHFYIRDILMEKFNVKYVIIIDDDQIFNKKWVERMWNLRKPGIYSGWYCKVWVDNFDYWEGSILHMLACKRNSYRYIHQVDYVGGCGFIIDTDVFKIKELWEEPTDLPDGVTIYNIDDLWLSFIARKNGFILERSYLPQQKTLNYNESLSKKRSLCNQLSEQKQKLFLYLLKNKSEKNSQILIT